MHIVLPLILHRYVWLQDLAHQHGPSRLGGSHPLLSEHSPTGWSTHREAVLLGHWAGLLFHFIACYYTSIFHCTTAVTSSSHTARGCQLISLSFKTTQKRGETKWVQMDVDHSCCFQSDSSISCSLRGRVKILSVISRDEHAVYVRGLGFQFWPRNLLTENVNISGFNISIFTN